MTTSIAVMHPKGGVGRSTTVYWLGYELARMHPTRAVLLADRDQGQHLSRMLGLYPPEVGNMYWGDLAEKSCQRALVTLIDTAPEANPSVLRQILAHADYLLVPVKGPEAGSVQVLPAFLRWIDGTSCKLLGFVPTMHKPRRAETRRWMEELRQLADAHNAQVFSPIPDLAAIASWHHAGHPYAALAAHIAQELVHGH